MIDPPTARSYVGARRRLVAQRIARLEERLRSVRDVRGEWTDEEHDPEGFATVSEWSQAEGAHAEHRAELRDLDDAERRIRDGSYGVCAVCGNAIPAAQLELRPARATCVACADGH